MLGAYNGTYWREEMEDAIFRILISPVINFSLKVKLINKVCYWKTALLPKNDRTYKNMED